MKIGRNDLCWCGSHKKYKSCHLAFDEKLESLAAKGHLIPDHSLIKTPEQIEGIRLSGLLNTEILDQVNAIVKPGISTEEINRFVHDFTTRRGAVPAPLGYQGFPKSVCTSINDEVCHGIPGNDIILQEGDIINIDVTTILNGYYSDASRMFFVGEVSDERKKIVHTCKECLDFGLKAAKPFSFLGDIGAVINNYAQSKGYSVVREIGGHGVGLEFHEEPWVSHLGPEGSGIVLAPGMVFTIEPMINAGSADVFEDSQNGWTIHTADGKDSAQWEYTIVITETGAEILTY